MLLRPRDGPDRSKDHRSLGALHSLRTIQSYHDEFEKAGESTEEGRNVVVRRTSSICPARMLCGQNNLSQPGVQP